MITITQLKKKLVGGHKKLIILLFILIINKPVFSSQILDYETEVFIKDIINDIRKVNKIKRDIKFVILSDNSINAFVDENNLIHVTSGLIQYSPDYVALLSVLAHEIGHIDNNHVAIRKSSIGKINNLKNISSLSIIAGTMISNNPQILQTFALSSASVSNFYINFTKEQEREADFYSLTTLKKLNLKSSSVIKLLKIIEKKALEKGLTREKQKLSSHPYFEERIKIASYLGEDNTNNINTEMENRFKLIRAKFLGYNANVNEIEKTENQYKLYSNSIVEAKKGNLENSLKYINELISTNINNTSILETKGDILYSYGYTNESIKFYKIVHKKQPMNKYAQIRIFTNTNFNNLSLDQTRKIFKNNLNLFMEYYNNQNILLNYLKLSERLSKQDWIDFINYWLNKNTNNIDLIKENLNKFKKTNDNNLHKLINLIYKQIK